MTPEPKEVCEHCFGTGNQLTDTGMRTCRCRASFNDQQRFVRARIPARYQACSLDNFKAERGPLQIAFMYACKFVLNYPSERGLLLAGPVGTGKSHIAVAIINRLIEQGKAECRFYEFGALLKQIQDSYNPTTQSSELSILAPVYEAEVLVLDELGASIPSEWVRDTMYQIINRRYNDRRPTIFTTNYLDDVGATSKTQTLEERIGPRLRSRLYEMTHKIEMPGDDYRKHLARRGLEVTKPESN